MSSQTWKPREQNKHFVAGALAAVVELIPTLAARALAVVVEAMVIPTLALAVVVEAVALALGRCTGFRRWWQCTRAVSTGLLVFQHWHIFLVRLILGCRAYLGRTFGREAGKPETQVEGEPSRAELP